MEVVANRVVDAILANNLTVENHFLFSLGKMPHDGQEYVVSVGVLNHVFTLKSEEAIKEAIRPYVYE